ncbi:MAG: rod shape-determining protein MreD [Atopobiaceae bacterium]|jgi:rod shape-determining protein MreD
MQVRDTNKDRRGIGTLAVVCAVLQLAIAPNIAIGNGRANIALVFAACVALSIGGRQGVLMGFLSGMFFDLSTTGPIGLMSLLLTVASFFMGIEERNRMSDDPLGSFTLFAGVSFVVTLLYHFAMLLVGQASSLFDVLVLRTLPTYLLTLLTFAIFEYFIVRRSGPIRGKHGGGRYTLGKM